MTSFIELQQAESTNNYATGLIHAGMARHGTAVFAHHQTAGKGQRQKQWHSEANKNIALTIIVQPEQLLLANAFLLSMAAAVGAYRFINTYTGDEAKIKWPNDIYWRDRKAAGILIENIIQGVRWKWSVVGIGVNINQAAFGSEVANAVSLRQITGKVFTPLLLAHELHQFFGSAYNELLSSREALIGAYKNALYKKNEEVTFKKEGRVFKGIVKDVTTDGRLVVQSAVEELFVIGEVEWII